MSGAAPKLSADRVRAILSLAIARRERLAALGLAECPLIDPSGHFEVKIAEVEALAQGVLDLASAVALYETTAEIVDPRRVATIPMLDHNEDAARVYEALRALPSATKSALYTFIHEAGPLFVNAPRPPTRVHPPVKGSP